METSFITVSTRLGQKLYENNMPFQCKYLKFISVYSTLSQMFCYTFFFINNCKNKQLGRFFFKK